MREVALKRQCHKICYLYLYSFYLSVHAVNDYADTVSA